MAAKKKKVVCKDCEHLVYKDFKWDYWPGSIQVATCTKGDLVFHPVRGDQKHFVDCKKKNAKGNCKDFKKQGPTQPVDIEGYMLPYDMVLDPDERIQRLRRELENKTDTLANLRARSFWARVFNKEV